MKNPLQFASALLAAAVFGGIVGSSLTRASVAPQAASAHPRNASARATPAIAAQRGADLTAYTYPARGGDSFDRNIQRARRDPAYLRELLGNYRFETELDRRGALLAVLQGVANQDVLRAGRELADSGDPRQRQLGLDLLKAFPLDVAEVRELLQRQLQDERDPAMLKQLVDMLAPTVIASEDAAPVLNRLDALRRHPDPSVRASSVLQSVQWNKAGDNEDILHRAILDTDASVRQAAIAGINASGARSDRLKDALLALAADPRSDGETRNAAVFALQNFAMNRAEYALYRQAAERAVDGDGHEREYPAR